MKRTLYPKGFTLAELLIVITILAILGTIGYISFVGYTQNARDTVRKSDVDSIETVLELYEFKNKKYPDPTDSFDVVYSGHPLWTQGTFGSQTQIQTKRLFGDLKDPKYGNNYAYSTTQSRNEYQLGVVYERTTIGRDDWRFTQNLIPQSYADASTNSIVNLDPTIFPGMKFWFDGRDVDADGSDDSSDAIIANVGVINDVTAVDFTPFYFDRVIWLDGQDISGVGEVLSDNSDINDWRNKTGAGFDAFVPQTGNGNGPVTSTPPSYTTNGFNGNPGVYFDGVQDRVVIDRGAQPKGSSFSLAYTFKINDAGGNSAENTGTNHATIISVGPTAGGVFFDQLGGWQLSRDGRNNSFVFRINGDILERNYFEVPGLGAIDCDNDRGIDTCGSSGTDAEAAFGDWSEVNDNEIHTVFLTYDSNILTGYLDGSKRFEMTLSQNSVPFAEYFRFYGNRAGSAYLEGHLGEVFVAGEKISLQDIEKVEGYFAHRWDWVDDLPAGHPYKINPPEMDALSQIDYTRYSGLGTIPDSFDSNLFYNTNPDVLNTKTVRYPGSLPDINISERNKVHIWRGPIKPTESGDYTFSLGANDYGFIKINGNTLVDAGSSTNGVQSATIALDADTIYDFELIYGIDQNYLPNLGSAHDVAPGYYNFDIDGEQFTTYVDAGGWILVASGQGSTNNSRYGKVRDLTLQSDTILNENIFSKLTNISEVRMSSPTQGGSIFDVSTSDSTVISRLLSYNILGYVDDATVSTWSGQGANHMAAGDCSGSASTDLDFRIYQACGNSSGLHWGNSREELTRGSNDIDLNLWIRADALVSNDKIGNLEYRVDGPGVIGYRKYAAFGWDDKSIAENDLNQSVESSQPSYNAGTQSFAFTPDQYFNFSQDPFSSGDDIEFFVVWEAENSDSVQDLDAYIFENTVGEAGSLQFGGSGMRAGSNELVSNSILGKQTQLSSYKLSSGGASFMEYFLGGQNYSVGNSDITSYDTPFYIGGKNEGFTGRVKEIIAYDTQLENSQREQIEGYLSHKWGIQHKLPGIHPYYEPLSSDDESFVELTGNYNGLFVHSSLGDSHIVVISPSIISSLAGNGTLDITTIQGENSFVYSGFRNVPASYAPNIDDDSKFVAQNGFFFDISQSKIFEGSQFELANYNGITQVDEAVRAIYTNSRLYESVSSYLEKNNSDYVKEILGEVIGINPITPFYCKDILEESLGSNIGFLANITGSSGESVSGGLETLNDGIVSVDNSYGYRTNPGDSPDITVEWDDVYDISSIIVHNAFGDISQNLWSANMVLFDENDTAIYEYTFGNTLGVGSIDIKIPESVSNQGIQKMTIIPVSDYDEIALREIEAFIGQRLISGIYKVDSDGIGGAGSYNVYCDMVTDGGGWTKVGENYINRGNFEGTTDPSRFSGYSVSGNVNNVSENTLRSDITPPASLPNASVLRHSGGVNSHYELVFEDIPDVEFSSEIRLGAWVRGSTLSPFYYSLKFEGEAEKTFQANPTSGANISQWRYETLRIPLSDTLETFTWKIGAGIDGTSTPLDVTGISTELYYK